jgi:XTP/dITP diphosphohydrolase
MASSRILIATTNAGKLTEIADVLLAVAGIELVSLGMIAPVPEPEETGATFADNARLKALYYARRSGMLTIAEDSGLVVDALDGEPGVRSARFLRHDATYQERFAEIERRLTARPDAPRTARFVCTAVVATEQVLFETTGVIEGLIAPTPSGDQGFGYDPIFYYPPYRATLADISRDAKMRVSHRGAAFRSVAEWLQRRGIQHRLDVRLTSGKTEDA